jgi:hypothetical protein
MSRSAMLARVAVIVLLLTASVAAGEQTVRVVPLPRDGEVLVSFKLEQPLTDEVRTAMHSGLAIKFVYRVELRRSAAVWFDRTIASAVVTATVKYDTLTQRYLVSRAVDGRPEWADTTDKEDTAWAALTNDFARMSLFHGIPLETNAEYYVRVRANASPRNSAFIWPWEGDDAVGFGKFTFVR